MESVATKFCTRCNTEKPASEFYEKQRKKECKQCARERQKKYRESEGGKMRSKEYYQRPDVKAKGKTADARNRPSQRKRWASNMFKILDIDPREY